jgi:hypothetical protein
MRTCLACMLGAALTFATALPAFAFNLSTLLGGQGKQQDINTFKIIHVADLASMIQAKEPGLHVYDANSLETRDKFGVIPGATLLSSVDDYNVAATLPAEKSTPLVFYCANTH